VASSCSAFAFSGAAPNACVPPHWVPIRHTLSALSGYWMATSWAIIPPMEAPTICAATIPSASSNCTDSDAICFTEYGPSGTSLLPAPRLSKRTSRCCASSSGTCRAHDSVLLPRPDMNNTGTPWPLVS